MVYNGKKVVRLIGWMKAGAGTTLLVFEDNSYELQFNGMRKERAA